MHGFQGFIGHGARIAAKNPRWHSLSVFQKHLAARRYVRSTSAASRKDAERARYKVQVPSLASKAFLSLKSLALKAYFKASLEILAKVAFPPSQKVSPQGRTDRKNPSKKLPEASCWQFFSIFCSSKLHSKFCIEKMTKKKRKSWILASPNPPQTLPKCLPNRTFK